MTELRHLTIAIVGLGQIGGSIALAVDGKVKKILGVSRNQAAKKIVKNVTKDISAIKEADIIILCRNIREIINVLDDVKRWRRKDSIVLDVGSTKEAIMTKARGINFIGGHPIAGTEQSGPQAASKTLFHDRPFVLIGRKNKLIGSLVRNLGAHPVWIPDGSLHDKSMAITSHLPHLIAYSLCELFRLKGIKKFFVGPSFRSAIRVARSNPKMVQEIFSTNSVHIKRAMTEFIRQLRKTFKDYKRKGFLNRLRKISIEL